MDESIDRLIAVPHQTGWIVRYINIYIERERVTETFIYIYALQRSLLILLSRQCS